MHELCSVTLRVMLNHFVGHIGHRECHPKLFGYGA